MNPSKLPHQTDDSSSPDSVLPDSTKNVYAPESNVHTAHDHTVGQIISGRFRVEHVIGVGSMGVVLAAKHIELDERVAIKFIRPEMQKLPGVLSRFAREAKAAVSIKSEHVAQVFDVGTAEGIGPYIVMEYLEGRDLGAMLHSEGRLAIGRAVHYVMQACEALAVAHSNGVTHRDIKPENLFLTRQGDMEVIKLLDFGISKAALTGKVFGDELSASESACLLGTPLYMSPEQIRATSEVDHRADIWSLGAVLYELITARSAFVADSVRQVWTRILETAPTPLSTHCPEAPPALQHVIDRCLDKDPAERFQNVAELAIALLPFAPSRARSYAQRASSILGTKSDSIIPAPMPPAMSIPMPSSTRPISGGAISTNAYLALPMPDMSAPPVFGHRASHSVTDDSRGRLFAAVAAAGILGALFMFWVGSQRGLPTASRVAARSVLSEGRLPPAPESEPANVAEMPVSRMVLIESQPSGALVKVGGQALGVTPLSTLLPFGTQQLTISKPGHRTEQAFIQVDPAAPGAKAVRARVKLVEIPAEAPAAASAKKERAAARPVPRRAAPRRAAVNDAREEPREAAAPIVPPPTAEEAVSQEAAPAQLLEEQPRARLLENEGRARLLE